MSNEREVDQRFLGEGRKATDELKKKIIMRERNEIVHCRLRVLLDIYI